MSALLKRFWTDHRLASVLSLALLFLGLLIKPWTLALVLAVAFGGPLLQRLESFSTSAVAVWRRSNWVALALLVGAVLLALTGKSGGQGALILALLPLAWVLVTDRGILRGENSAATGPATRAAVEPGITAPPPPDPETAPPAVQTQAQIPLVGSELLNKIRELGDIGKSDLVRACGYVSTKADGGERLNFTAFYEALLEAKGVELSAASSEANEQEEGDSTTKDRSSIHPKQQGGNARDAVIEEETASKDNLPLKASDRGFAIFASPLNVWDDISGLNENAAIELKEHSERFVKLISRCDGCWGSEYITRDSEKCSRPFYVVERKGDCLFSLVSQRTTTEDERARVFSEQKVALASKDVATNGRVYACVAFSYKQGESWIEFEDFDREETEDGDPFENIPSIARSIGEDVEVYLKVPEGDGDSEIVFYGSWDADGDLEESEELTFDPHEDLLKSVIYGNPFADLAGESSSLANDYIAESPSKEVQPSSARESSYRSLPPAEEIASRVIIHLDEIIDENIDDFDSDGSYKVRPDYGYGKFYLDSVDGSYDMSLQGLVHYIMHEEDIYEEFLNQAQLNAVQKCIDEYPEAIYAVDTSEGNGEEVESVLDEIYHRCISHVAKRLKSADLDIEAFADYLSDDEDGEDEDNSNLDQTVVSTSEELRQTEPGETALTNSESKPLGINNSVGAFSLSVIKSKISKPDDDGDISIDLELSLESHSDEDVELVGSKLVVLTASGLPLLEREDQHDLLITNGSSEGIRLYSGYFKASQIAGSPTSETQVLVQLTPCGCRFTELPLVEIPTSGNISGISEKIEVQPEIQLQGFSIIRSKPDEEGNCQLELKGLVTSQRKSALSKVVVSIQIHDRNGREIESTEWSEKVSPSSTICLDTSLWGIKPSRLEGARAHISLKSFHPLGNQELSWCVGSKPKPTEFDASNAKSAQRGLEEQAPGPLAPADIAASLPAKVMENTTSNNFDLAITSANYSSPDEDGDTRYEVGYSIINQSDQTIELMLSRLFVLHSSGLVVATTQDESEDMAENGESISATSSTWGTSVKELDGDASSAQLMLQVTACSCSFVELGAIECPASGRATTLEPSDQDSDGLVVEAITITAEPPDEGECCIRIKALVRNKTDLSFPRTVLSTKLMSASGRELDDTYSQEEIHPNSQIVLEDSFWGVKENRMNSAKLQFSLKAFAAVGNSTVVTRDLSLED